MNAPPEERMDAKEIVALICDEMGIVREVIKDDAHRFDAIPLNKPLTAFMHPTSLEKVRFFLQEIQTNGIAMDWEMVLPVRDNKLDMLRFTGLLHDKRIYVVGATDLSVVVSQYEAILNMYGDQITMLRAEVKRRKELSEQFQRMSMHGYEEVTRLNNELVTMQRDLIKKTRQLEALNQEKNLFLGVAAHDLRNPIGNILGLSELLQAELKGSLNEECLQYFQLIDGSCTFMLQMISDLLDYSRIEAGKLETDSSPVELDKLVALQVDASRKSAHKKELDIVFIAQGERPFTLRGNSQRLMQVIDNLLTNAVKFSNGPNQIQVTLRREPGSIMLSVQDHGQGIPVEEHDKLFKPFSKSSARPTAGERSTGLGLSIVKRIVEAHGGIVGVDSAPGRGTTMTVRLPAL